MDMRLAYRIAQKDFGFIIQPGADEAFGLTPDFLKSNLEFRGSEIAKAKRFIFDNVAMFYAQHKQLEWDLKFDFPNFAPPFDNFFVEWNEPELDEWNDGTTHSDERNVLKSLGMEGIKICAGVHVMVFEIAKLVANRERWGNIFAGFTLCKDFSMEQKLWDALEKAKWVLLCDRWYCANKGKSKNKAIWDGVQHIVFVDQCGKILEYGTTGVGFADAKSVTCSLHILGLGISFLHCKNVKKVEVDGERGSWIKRKKSMPTLKFYTLDINPMKQILRTEGKSEETGIKKALHICRGHFATYTPEHPLFGKYVGTFWKADHVRGHSPAGIVDKDYRVNL